MSDAAASVTPRAENEGLEAFLLAIQGSALSTQDWEALTGLAVVMGVAPGLLSGHLSFALSGIKLSHATREGHPNGMSRLSLVNLIRAQILGLGEVPTETPSELVMADQVKRYAETLAGDSKAYDPGRLLALALISLTSVPQAKSLYFGG